jgi:hypothetical protein
MAWRGREGLRPGAVAVPPEGIWPDGPSWLAQDQPIWAVQARWHDDTGGEGTLAAGFVSHQDGKCYPQLGKSETNSQSRSGYQVISKAKQELNNWFWSS